MDSRVGYNPPKYAVGRVCVTIKDEKLHTIHSITYAQGGHWYYMTDGSGPWAEIELKRYKYED